MKLLILVFGLVLIVEGMPYAAAPERMQEWMLRLSEAPAKTLRIIGISSMGAGLFICWIVQKTGLFS